MIQRARRLADHWLDILIAVVFWCLLWGGFSFQDIAGGLLAAAIVHILFPMPSISRELSLRPLAFIWFVAKFLFDMVVSAVQIAWYAIRPGEQPGASVIAVQMASRSDLFLTITAGLSTLIPGTVVVEAQRGTGTIFLHVIGAETPEEAEAARVRVREQEHRLLRALARRDVLKEAGLA